MVSEPVAVRSAAIGNASPVEHEGADTFWSDWQESMSVEEFRVWCKTRIREIYGQMCR